MKEVSGEFRVFMNWKTGLLVQLDDYLHTDQQREEGLEQVFLCWHAESDCAFIDPVMSRKEPRHDTVEYLELVDFRNLVRKLTGEEMPLDYAPGRIVSQYDGQMRSSVLNASLEPGDTLKYRIQRLDAALAELNETIGALTDGT